MGKDMMDSLQALISDELKKYHEEKIRRDLGEEPKPGPGLRKARLPRSLISQYFQFN